MFAGVGDDNLKGDVPRLLDSGNNRWSSFVSVYRKAVFNTACFTDEPGEGAVCKAQHPPGTHFSPDGNVVDAPAVVPHPCPSTTPLPLPTLFPSVPPVPLPSTIATSELSPLLTLTPSSHPVPLPSELPTSAPSARGPIKEHAIPRIGEIPSPVPSAQMFPQRASLGRHIETTGIFIGTTAAIFFVLLALHVIRRKSRRLTDHTFTELTGADNEESPGRGNGTSFEKK